MTRTSDTIAAMKEIGEAEEVVYVPKNGGDERTIDVIVDRAVMDASGAPVDGFRVLAENDLTRGIALSELDAKLDKMRIAERVGEDVEIRNITGLIEQDSEAITIRVK